MKTLLDLIAEGGAAVIAIMVLSVVLYGYLRVQLRERIAG